MACHGGPEGDLCRLLIPDLPYQAVNRNILLEHGAIIQKLKDMLICWNHHSCFNAHTKERIDGAAGKTIENAASYIK